MKLQNTTISLRILFILVISIGCSNQKENIKTLDKVPLIPQPVTVNSTGSSFLLSKNSQIRLSENSDELNNMAVYFNELISSSTGYQLKIPGETSAKDQELYFSLNTDNEISGDNGYVLTITEKQMKLEAKNYVGLFHGIQTIRQLLNSSFEGESTQETDWQIGTGQIIDYPKFSYRGAMLDVSRHFFSVSEVKVFIDWLAMFKMNYLHLHLSDDQGWRIEIKKWPKLTETGGSTEVGGGLGGFYTQEDFKEIVRYASERYITIIPEIDMPGHTNAALASYALLNCDGQEKTLYTGIEVGFSSLCTDKEITYQFLDDVIGEISAISPSSYFHIGGDESHATAKKDYQYFLTRVQEIVSKHNKNLIGWDEVATIDLLPGSIVQIWNSKDNALKAINQNKQVILSPASHAYLDMKYDSTTTFGLNWAGYIEVDKAYDWIPEQFYDQVKADDILGIECPLWTETVTNIDEAAYLVFPRLPGYAEIGWSATKNRTWIDYQQRLGKYKSWFEKMGLNYYQSPKVDWQ